jgi:integrase
MEELYNTIKKYRTNVSESTIKTYGSLLKSLFYKAHDKDVPINIEWFKKQDDIIELLKDKKPQNRKTTYAALIAICNDQCSDKYKKHMADDKQYTKQLIDKQEKSDKQKDNWEDYDKIKEVHDTMLTNTKKYLNSKTPLNKREFSSLQDFIIVCLTTGMYFPPRRSTDWTEMRLRGDIDKEKDNYIDKDNFVFNIYKTKKIYDTQKVPIPPEFRSILKKWAKHNDNDYLLVDDNNNKLNNVKLGQRLNRIFDKKISTSMLRHIYLSDKLKDIPKLTHLQDLAKDMGHSVEEQLQYIKHNK